MSRFPPKTGETHFEARWHPSVESEFVRIGKHSRCVCAFCVAMWDQIATGTITPPAYMIWEMHLKEKHGLAEGDATT